MNIGKSAGSDEYTAEFLKFLGEAYESICGIP